MVFDPYKGLTAVSGPPAIVIDGFPKTATAAWLPRLDSNQQPFG